MNRGDVWWYESPEVKARPVVILTRDAVIPHLHRLVVAPMTRRARAIPTEVDLDRSDGMPGPCVVSLDNVQLVTKAHLTRRITTLAPGRMLEICRALHVAVEC